MSGLFLFLDGVGLGDNNPNTNPFAANSLPNLYKLLGGNKLVLNDEGLVNQNLVFKAIDASLGVQGLPQSASGQTAILTGKNAPLLTGGHYGPKPNHALRDMLEQGTIFHQYKLAGKKIELLNAYPETYFKKIRSGKRLHGCFPYAAAHAGIPLKTTQDLIAGQAISADFTGRGWHEQLHQTNIPILEPFQAGRLISRLVHKMDLAVIDYWPSDLAGHHQDKKAAASLLYILDKVLGGILSDWNPQQDWLVITSDHGNLEDLSTRRHTANPVPLIYYGPETIIKFITNVKDISGIFENT